MTQSAFMLALSRGSPSSPSTLLALLSKQLTSTNATFSSHHPFPVGQLMTEVPSHQITEIRCEPSFVPRSPPFHHQSLVLVLPAFPWSPYGRVSAWYSCNLLMSSNSEVKRMPVPGSSPSFISHTSIMYTHLSTKLPIATNHNKYHGGVWQVS